MKSVVGHLENIEKVPDTEHLEFMDFVCPQYTTQIVTGVHYGVNERGFHIQDGEVVPDVLAKEMKLYGRLGGNKKNRVRSRVMRGVQSNGIFYGQIGPHWNDRWKDGTELEWEEKVIDAGPILVVSWVEDEVEEAISYPA